VFNNLESIRDGIIIPKTTMRNVIELLAFHDERAIHHWLYHGFVFCEIRKFPDLKSALIESKKEADCDPSKRIHFSKLRSSSNTSSKTRTAVKWMDLFVKQLHQTMWFYLLGINLENIDYKLFGPPSNGQVRDIRIYNRFFEIGLFSACRFFFDPALEDVEIHRIYSEKRDLEEVNPFLIQAPYKINQRSTNVSVKSKQIIQVASDISREKANPEYVDIVNFVDVLIGAFSQNFDYTSRSRACTEVAERLYTVCCKLSQRPYNKNSPYYKRYAMSFFPKVKQSRSSLLDNIEPMKGQFYSERTVRLYQPEYIPGFGDLIS